MNGINYFQYIEYVRSIPIMLSKWYIQKKSRLDNKRALVEINVFYLSQTILS